MKYNPNIHHRRSIRLQDYDYSQQGLYFITICTQNKLCLFGKIEDGNMQLNVAGNMIRQQWLGLVHRFNTIKLHEFIVMPNHFHGIIELVGVPLVGTQNDENPHFANQPQTKQSQMGQLSIVLGQPQGIAPTINVQNAKHLPNVEPSQTEQSQMGPSPIIGQQNVGVPLVDTQNDGNLRFYKLKFDTTGI